MSKALKIGIGAIILIISILIIFISQNLPKGSDNQILLPSPKIEEVMDKDKGPARKNGDTACTQEAKQCPDGSFVGRAGPNCEFTKCPTQITNQTNPIQLGQYLENTGIQNLNDLQKHLIQNPQTKSVIFFHAPWCPYCKAADKEFIDHAQEIPAEVAVIKVDYDSNTELKQKYGVTYQHTFVQVDKEGNQITKWNGGDIENLKKYLR